MCFWDCSKSNKKLIDIIKNLTETYYLNCIVILINNPSNLVENIEDFESISLLVHTCHLEEINNKFNLCRFILLDEFELQYNNQILKLIYGLIGIHFDLPLLFHTSIQEEIPNILDNLNIYFYSNETFKNDFDNFQKHFQKEIINLNIN